MARGQWRLVQRELSTCSLVGWTSTKTSKRCPLAQGYKRIDDIILEVAWSWRKIKHKNLPQRVWKLKACERAGSLSKLEACEHTSSCESWKLVNKLEAWGSWKLVKQLEVMIGIKRRDRRQGARRGLLVFGAMFWQSLPCETLITDPINADLSSVHCSLLLSLNS